MELAGYGVIAALAALGALAAWHFDWRPRKANLAKVDRLIEQNTEAVDIRWCAKCGRPKQDPRMWLCHRCNGWY